MIPPTDVSLTPEQQARSRLTAIAYAVALEYGSGKARQDFADGLAAAAAERARRTRAGTPRPITPRPVRPLHPKETP